MVNKVEGLDLQHDMKKRNNKPGCKAIGEQEARAIRDGKQTVRTKD